VPFLGTYSWLQYEKAQVKKQVKRKMISELDQKELVLLKLSKLEAEKELNWEHSKEFEYHEQMYDVVSTEIVGDSIHYYCWLDQKETLLNKKLNDLVNKILRNEPLQKKSTESLSDFMKGLFYCDKEQMNFQLASSELIAVFQKRFLFSDYKLSPPVPPPRLA
jgi:hypothetical protein